MLRFVINTPATSLEIGCREGLFSKRLKQDLNVTETWGIEPDCSAIEEVKQNIDNFIHDFFPAAANKFPPEYFDLIVFNDVLEHMYDPWQALERCHEILKRDGIIVASIPNIRHKPIIRDLILYDKFEYQDSGNLDISHIRFFTKKSMIKLFEDTHYTVIMIDPVNPIKNIFKKFMTTVSFKWLESFYVHQYAIVAKSNRKGF